MATATEKALVMIAFDLGRKIEAIAMYGTGNKWHPAERPSWDWDHYNFRIMGDPGMVIISWVDVSQDKVLGRFTLEEAVTAIAVKEPGMPSAQVRDVLISGKEVAVGPHEVFRQQCW